MSTAASPPRSDEAKNESRSDEAPRRVVLMGVAGSGKTTIGVALAPLWGGIYIDGDDLHPRGNIAKMSRGEPLTDADRAPWLDRVGETLAAQAGRAIIGCSALKRSYRDRIRGQAGGQAVFVLLSGSRAVIEARMTGRTGHFMPLGLLDSQFADLEPFDPDEAGFSVDIDRSVPAIVEAILAGLD